MKGVTRRGFLAATGSGVVAAALPLASQAGVRVPAAAEAVAARPRPTPSQLAWQREELSMFVHFTVNTFTGSEWGDGSESPSIFAPRKLDAKQWARTAKECGFGSMILTAKHHDGFCLWPTKTTKHSVASSPWRGGQGDVVREFTDACRAEGLGVGFYLSPWDRNAKVYGQGKAYDDFYIEQLTELLTGYGPVVEVWFDGANGEGPNGKRQQYDWPRIIGTVRRLQPDAVIFSDMGDVRWIGNESGVAGDPCWATTDPSLVSRPGMSEYWVVPSLNRGEPYGSAWRPGEADVSIRPGWFWHAEEDDKVRSADNLLELYRLSVGRNSKLLLNVPPTADGLFHPRDLDSLRGFGELREAMLATDFAAGAKARASAAQRDATNVLHDDHARIWTPGPDARSGWIELEFPHEVEFDLVRLEEAIEFGQHIAGYRVDADDGKGWRPLAWGNTIGNRKFERVPPTRARRLRVVIDFAYATPRLARIALHHMPSGARQRPDYHGG